MWEHAVSRIWPVCRAVFTTFTLFDYERIHRDRNRFIHRCFAVLVILHWLYLIAISYLFTNTVNYIILFGIHLPSYLLLAAATFTSWPWTRLTSTLWYLLVSYIGCSVPVVVNWYTFSCLRGGTSIACQDAARPGYLNNLLYSSVGPLIIITVFRNSLPFQLLNNALILISLSLQAPYALRSTWLNFTMLVGAYLFFFLLRVNQNRNEYASHASGLRLQTQVERGIELSEQQGQAARTREWLTNYIFHEIRVPLNTVVLSVDLLQDNFSIKKHLSDDEQDTFDQVKSGLGAIQTVVNDALDVRRLEEGRLQIDPEPLDLATFIRNLVWVLSPSWTRKEVQFEYTVDERLPVAPLRFMGDSVRLKQIISNLLSNAVKFTPTRGTIRLSVVLVDGLPPGLRVAVKDTGIGISPQNQAKLFQDYVQVNANRSQQGSGSGLGLAICAHLVRLHGGTIGVNSTVNVGSEFWFEIPLVVQSNEHRSNSSSTANSHVGPASQAPSHPPSVPPPERKKLRILVTDDDRGTRAVMQKILAVRLGHEVDLAGDGIECLEHVSTAQKNNAMYDLFFMDSQMPRMDGSTTITHLRLRGVSQPIVFLTGSADLQPHEPGTRVMIKPVKIQDIERMLARLFPSTINVS